MHAIEACEIPLLRSSASAFRFAAPTVRAMWAHLDGAAEKARPSDSPNLSGRSTPSTGAGLHARPTLLQASGRGLAGVSVPISPGAATVCRAPHATEAPARTARAAGRWPVVRVRRIPWVLYLTALKPCRGDYATFLDPLLLPGKEGASRWQQAVAAIPPSVRHRIRA